MVRLFCIVIFMQFMVGCASNKKAHIENLNVPVAQIKAAVKASLPMGKRAVEQGGRIYLSNYF